MPRPLAVDREAVRVLVVALGSAEAARKMGLNADTVRQWAKRGGWTEGAVSRASLVTGEPTPAKLAMAATLPESMRPVIVTGVTKPADALREALEDDSRETRLSLSRSARKMARDAENAPLNQAGDVLQVGKLSALTHGWETGGGGDRFQLNTFNITLPQDERPVIDV